jgi:hypothetical protein
VTPATHGQNRSTALTIFLQEERVSFEGEYNITRNFCSRAV